MEINEEEMRALVMLLSDMTQYEYGSHGLGYKERVAVQLMYNRLATYIEALEVNVVEEVNDDG